MLRRPARFPFAAITVPILAVLVLSSCSSASSGGGPGAAGTTPSGSPSGSGSASPGSVRPSASVPVPPSASASAPAPAAPSGCVQRQLAGLSLAERAGQLLMIGTPAGDASPGVALVRRYRLGGVFLHGRSSSPVASVRSRTDALRAATPDDGPGLLVAADQEGGLVQTLTGRGFTGIPAALVQGGWSTSRLSSATRIWGAALADAGVSLDLAPVADTVTAARAPKNPPVGEFQREYGHDTADVSAAVRTVVKALDEVKVLTTVKHFPGLGRVTHNTDTSAAAVDAVTAGDDVYLQPFIAGIEAGAGAVMISSATYPKLDRTAVAAFSAPIVTGLLRRKLGYAGVVISDDLGLAKAVADVPVGQRAVRFVRAGGDIVLSVRSSDAKPMRQALIDEANASREFRATLDAAVVRVLQLKERAGLLPC